MSFLFASSHLPQTRVRRPEDEEEEERKRGIRALRQKMQAFDAKQPVLRSGGVGASNNLAASPEDDEDDMQPMLRSGSVRAFSHLPERRAYGAENENAGGGMGAFNHLPQGRADDATSEHADAGSHARFEPPAPAGGATQGPIGPTSPRGTTPPVGGSRFLAQRPMPPQFAQQEAKTYGAAAENRGGAGSSGSGNQPASTTSSTRPRTLDDAVEQGRIAKDEAQKKWDKLKNPEAEAEPKAEAEPAVEADPTVAMIEQQIPALEREVEGLKEARHKHSEGIDRLKKIRMTVGVAGFAQGVARYMAPPAVDLAVELGNEILGSDPKDVIEKIDAEISKREDQKLKYQEAIAEAEGKLSDAKKKLEAAKYMQKKQDLQKKQNQSPATPPTTPAVRSPAGPGVHR